jgi:hypothetical protein
MPMLNAKRSLAAVSLLAVIALSACGSSAEAPPPTPARIVAVPGSSTGKILLTQLGANRIGVQTSAVRAVRPAKQHNGPSVVIPYSSLVYAADGSTYAFTSPAALVFTEVPVTVARIDGDSVYLLKGPRPGARVVTVGAEELLGVETGVLAQT